MVAVDARVGESFLTEVVDDLDQCVTVENLAEVFLGDACTIDFDDYDFSGDIIDIQAEVTA